jgi:glycosyltransferase involved in cell wall biosynthesis
MWRLWRLFRRERFTIVHTHQVKAALFAQMAARLAGVPIVVNTIHGFYFHEGTPLARRRAWIALERFAARFSTLLLSQNREDIPTAIAEGICPPDRIEHLGNGIDIARFDRAAIAPDALARLRAEFGFGPQDVVLGFVGRLVREKGILELFEAVRQLRARHRRLRLLVIGPIDADKPDALQPSVAASFGIGDIVAFAGYRSEMPELYGLMDVSALPSHREGLPRAPMEAAAMGVPVVATAIRGCREVVRDGETGFLVPVGDAGRLAEALDRILSDPGLARRMAVEARRVAVSDFDERLVFARVKSAYVRLLRARGIDPAVHEAGETAEV